MRDKFDKDRDFRYGWTCPSCDRNFNPSIDECKFCNYPEEKCVDEDFLKKGNNFREQMLKAIEKRG